MHEVIADLSSLRGLYLSISRNKIAFYESVSSDGITEAISTGDFLAM